MVLINALTDQAVELHYVSENMLLIIASYMITVCMYMYRYKYCFVSCLWTYIACDGQNVLPLILYAYTLCSTSHIFIISKASVIIIRIAIH